MYPSVLPQIRDAIKRRYELIPYLYELCFRSCLDAQPIQRWVGWEPYDADPEVWKIPSLREGESQFFLGDAFLVGGVFEECATQVTIYLPSCTEICNKYESYHNDGFISIHPPYRYYPSGQWITIPTPLSNIAVLARVGAVVPVGRPWATTASPDLEPNLPLDDWRGIEIFPPPPSHSVRARVYVGQWREDDGISKNSEPSEFEISYEANEHGILVRAKMVRQGVEAPWGQALWIIVPVGEHRPVFVLNRSGEIHAPGQQTTDSKGRHMYCIRGLEELENGLSTNPGLRVS